MKICDQEDGLLLLMVVVRQKHDKQENITLFCVATSRACAKKDITALINYDNLLLLFGP